MTLVKENGMYFLLHVSIKEINSIIKYFQLVGYSGPELFWWQEEAKNDVLDFINRIPLLDGDELKAIKEFIQLGL